MNNTLDYIRELVDEFLKPKERKAREGDNVPPEKKIWPSALSGCLRQQWYSRKLPRTKNYNPKMEVLAKIGTGFHKVIGKSFTWVDIRREELGGGYVLSGVPDAIVGEDKEDQATTLLEFKTRDNVNVYRRDWIQVGSTALLFPEAKEAAVVVFGRSTHSDKVYEIFHASKRRLTLLKNLAKKRINLLIDCLENNELPKDEPFIGCQDCPWQLECNLNSKESEESEGSNESGKEQSHV